MFNSEQFSHLYIEDKARDYLLTLDIQKKFPTAKIVNIKHYKDVFSSYKNNFRVQKKSQKIILAKKESGFLYPIGKFIQNQGKNNFYYSSMVLNCIYDCEYCFLQGMHQSSHIVIFVNTDDFFDEIKKKLKEVSDIFVSISYDSDLLALEKITNLISLWIDFANNHDNLSLEIRTKSNNFKSISHLYNKNTLLNFSLSPEHIIQNYEHKTSSLKQRINSINNAMSLKWKVAIVIDPILDIKNAITIYQEFIIYLMQNINFNHIDSVIVGTFRMSSKYLKIIQKTNLKSDLLYYPYEVKDKMVSYPQNTHTKLVECVKSEILKHNKNMKIYEVSDDD